MKIFQTVEKNFVHLGLYSNQSSPSFNVKNVLFLGICTVATVSAYIPVFQSATFVDLTESIFFVSTIVLIGIQYSAIAYKIPYFYQLRNSYQNIINTSKFIDCHLNIRDFKRYEFIFI